MNKNIVKILKLIVPLSIGLYLIWYFYHILSEEEKNELFQALREANYWWLLPSLLVGVASHMSRAFRWKYLLEPMGYNPPFKSSFNALMIGYIVNLIIPRAGEVSRAAILKRTDQVPFEKSFGTIVMERIVDIVMLGIIFLFAIGSQYNQLGLIQDRINRFQENQMGGSSSGLGFWIIILMTMFFLAVLAFVFINNKFKTKLFKMIKGGWEGFKSIKRSKNKIPFIFHTVFIWLMYILMFGLCFYALPKTSDMPLAGILAGFVAGTVGLIFVQGGIGVYPALVGVIITTYLFPEYTSSPVHPIGIAMGWIIWASQTLLMVLLGLTAMIITPAKKIVHYEAS